MLQEAWDQRLQIYEEIWNNKKGRMIVGTKVLNINKAWNALELESEVTSQFMQEIRQLKDYDGGLNVSILHSMTGGTKCGEKR